MSTAESPALFRHTAELERRMGRLDLVLVRLHAALTGDLPNLVTDLGDAGDVPRLVRLYLRLEALRAELAESVDVLEGVTAEALGPGVIVDAEYGRVEAKRSADRKAWDHDGLRGALIRQVRAGWRLVCFLAGAPADDLEEEAYVLSAVVGAARPEWRVTPLRAVGLDVDEFCSTTWGPRRLVVTPLDAGSPA